MFERRKARRPDNRADDTGSTLGKTRSQGPKARHPRRLTTTASLGISSRKARRPDIRADTVLMVWYLYTGRKTRRPDIRADKVLSTTSHSWGRKARRPDIRADVKFPLHTLPVGRKARRPDIRADEEARTCTPRCVARPEGQTSARTRFSNAWSGSVARPEGQTSARTLRSLRSFAVGSQGPKARHPRGLASNQISLVAASQGPKARHPRGHLPTLWICL